MLIVAVSRFFVSTLAARKLLAVVLPLAARKPTLVPLTAYWPLPFRGHNFI